MKELPTELVCDKVQPILESVPNLQYLLVLSGSDGVSITTHSTDITRIEQYIRKIIKTDNLFDFMIYGIQMELLHKWVKYNQ